MKLDVETSNKFTNLSFLAACLVVFIHTPFMYSDGAVDQLAMKLIRFGLCCVAVPFFFFASGFFLMGKYAKAVRRKDVYFESIRKRISTLLVPFLIFNTIAFGLKHAVARDWASLSLLDVVSQYGLNPFCHPIYHLLWYIVSLFVLIIIAPCLVAGIERSRRTAVAFCVGLFGVCLSAAWAGEQAWFNVKLAFAIDHMFSILGLFFFVLGMFVRRWLDRVPGRVGMSVAAIALGLWLCYVFTCKPVAMVCAALVIGYGLMILVPGVAWSKRLVRNAFAIYLLHGLLLFGYRLAFPRANSAGAAGWFTVAVGAIVLCLLIVETMRKFMPRVAQIVFGGR